MFALPPFLTTCSINPTPLFATIPRPCNNVALQYGNLPKADACPADDNNGNSARPPADNAVAAAAPRMEHVYVVRTVRDKRGLIIQLLVLRTKKLKDDSLCV